MLIRLIWVMPLILLVACVSAEEQAKQQAAVTAERAAWWPMPPPAQMARAPNPSRGNSVEPKSNYDPYTKRQFSNPGSGNCCDAF
jgi:hypothetical protein